MQAAAMAPVALDEASIPADLIDKERSIGRELAIQEGKPEAMADKIAEGRLKKWFKEATFGESSIYQGWKNERWPVRRFNWLGHESDRILQGSLGLGCRVSFLKKRASVLVALF